MELPKRGTPRLLDIGVAQPCVRGLCLRDLRVGDIRSSNLRIGDLRIGQRSRWFEAGSDGCSVDQSILHTCGFACRNFAAYMLQAFFQFGNLSFLLGIVDDFFLYVLLNLVYIDGLRRHVSFGWYLDHESCRVDFLADNELPVLPPGIVLVHPCGVHVVVPFLVSLLFFLVILG